jgi:hypothetical protein
VLHGGQANGLGLKKCKAIPHTQKIKPIKTNSRSPSPGAMPWPRLFQPQAADFHVPLRHTLFRLAAERASLSGSPLRLRRDRGNPGQSGIEPNHIVPDSCLPPLPVHAALRVEAAQAHIP